MEGDSNTYQVDNIDLAAFLPDEDVYKPKKNSPQRKKD